MNKDWKTIPGWMDYEITYERIVNEQPGGIIVEVGTYLGKSLCCLGQLVMRSRKPFRVVGVDTCLGSGVENGNNNHLEAVKAGGGNFAGQLLSNILDCGLQGTVSLILAESATASSLFADQSVSAVFLDAGHDYQSVISDIRAWLPKVKVGGIIGGDDMGVPGEVAPIWPGIRDAVNECFRKDWIYSPHDAWLHYKKV